MKKTTNYDLFSLVKGNRDVDLSNTRTKVLAESDVFQSVKYDSHLIDPAITQVNTIGGLRRL